MPAPSWPGMQGYGEGKSKARVKGSAQIRRGRAVQVLRTSLLDRDIGMTDSASRALASADYKHCMSSHPHATILTSTSSPCGSSNSTSARPNGSPFAGTMMASVLVGMVVLVKMGHDIQMQVWYILYQPNAPGVWTSEIRVGLHANSSAGQRPRRQKVGQPSG